MLTSLTFLFLTVSLGVLDSSKCVIWTQANPQSVEDDLKALLSSNSEVVLRSNPTYTEDFTPRYNTAGEPTYIVGVKPALVTDVQKVVSHSINHTSSNILR